MTKEVIFEKYKVTVRRATVRDGLERGSLISRAVEKPQEDEIAQTAAVVLYPSAVACSDFELVDASEKVDREGKYITLDYFLSLPEDFMNRWLEAVYALNPHWSPGGYETEKELDEKKD